MLFNRREPLSLSARIAAATAQVDAVKAEAAEKLKQAEDDLAAAIAALDSTPVQFQPSQRAVIRARRFIRDTLANVAG